MSSARSMSSQQDAAREAFEHGLRVLADAHWPLLLAELRLRLGQGLAGSTLPPPSQKPGPLTSSGNGSDHPSPRAAPRC